MTQINFPVATADGQTFDAPNGVIYTYVGTPPNGYWSGTFQNESLQTLDGRYLKLDSSNDPITGRFTVDSGADYTGNNPAEGNSTASFITETAAVGIGSHTGVPYLQGFGTNTQFNLKLNPEVGNVGIGTGSGLPGSKLHVRSSSGDVITCESTSSNSWIRYIKSGSSEFRAGVDDTLKYVINHNSNDLVKINTSGQVGLGLNPTAPVDIQLPSSGRLKIEEYGTASVTLNSALSSTSRLKVKANRFEYENDTGTTQFCVTAAGRVGILTDDPGKTLDVRGEYWLNKPSDFWSSGNSVFLGYGNIATQGSYRVDITSNGYRDGAGKWVSLGINGYGGAAQVGVGPTGYIAFACQASKATGANAAITERARINTQGLVIGSSDLDNTGDACLYLAGNESSESGRVAFRSYARRWFIGGNTNPGGLTIGRRISSNTADSTSIHITDQNQVGFFTKSPTEMVTLNHGSQPKLALAINNTTKLRIQGLTAATYWDSVGSDIIWRVGSGGTTEAMRIQNSNSILRIDGVTLPTSVRGSICTTGRLAAESVYSLTTAGSTANVHVKSNGVLERAGSSARYKTDIETLDNEHADNILENARPVWFRSVVEGDNPDWSFYGFIAEEVAKVDPRLAQYEEFIKVPDETKPMRADGTPELKWERSAEPVADGVNHTFFIPVLVNIVKRQRDQINDLTARVAALEA